MKKGILQRVSKNWEETKLASAPEVKLEPTADYAEPPAPIPLPLESNKVAKPITLQRQTETKRGQRESMISIRKDYSYKYSAATKTPTTPTDLEKSPRMNILPSTIASPSSSVQSNKKALALKPSPAVLKPRDSIKRSMNSTKSPISILERRDYDKGPSQPKLIKVESKAELSPVTVIDPAKKPNSPANDKSQVPSRQSEAVDNVKCETERERLKVIFAQNVESPVKQEFDAQQLLKTPTTPTEPKDPQNINKINNKINIIFQLNDNAKSLRKNIILHRRAPKKIVQKITIKETNNNTKIQTDEAAFVPEKVVCSIDTQTDIQKRAEMTLTTTNPLSDELTEHLFFEDDILISLQQATISFFEYNRLGSLLKRGETEFKLIDRVPRRLHDTLVDPDNKFQRLCYNDQNDLPIYVEMRAKQKELDDPDMCPIAFLYCNVYYIDQRRAKFSSVHLDTVKSIVGDIIYTTVPGSSYFIMAWNEKSPETKELGTGIVKYKLTPNLDLAKLASIRQFPKLNYRTKLMSCGKNSQLMTFGDSQVSIFNYESGDLLMSLDLMKNYGTNLTTFAFKENYLFMVYLADEGASSSQRVIVIGVNKCDGNTFKVIQSTPVKLRKGVKIVSKSITSTNHLLVTFSNESVFMMSLLNFRDVHFHTSAANESIYAADDHLLTASNRNVGLRHFTEFFLN